MHWFKMCNRMVSTDTYVTHTTLVPYMKVLSSFIHTFSLHYIYILINLMQMTASNVWTNQVGKPCTTIPIVSQNCLNSSDGLMTIKPLTVQVIKDDISLVLCNSWLYPGQSKAVSIHLGALNTTIWIGLWKMNDVPQFTWLWTWACYVFSEAIHKNHTIISCTAL